MPQIETDAVYNYDDLYISGESTNDLGFLGQYSNEKFIGRKTRKARITYGPDATPDAVVVGTNYSIGYIPARAIMTGAWAIVTVDTAQAGIATVKVGTTDLGTVATEVAGATEIPVPIAEGYNESFREVTVSFDTAITPEAGSITIIYEYLDAEVIEGPFGS